MISQQAQHIFQGGSLNHPPGCLLCLLCLHVSSLSPATRRMSRWRRFPRTSWNRDGITMDYWVRTPPQKKKQELNIVKSKQRTAAKLAGSEKRTESLCIRFGSQTWPWKQCINIYIYACFPIWMPQKRIFQVVMFDYRVETHQLSCPTSWRGSAIL